MYFVNTRLTTWGTSGALRIPIMMRDPDFRIVCMRAGGNYDFRVADVRDVSGEELAG